MLLIFTKEGEPFIVSAGLEDCFFFYQIWNDDQYTRLFLECYVELGALFENTIASQYLRNNVLFLSNN